MRRRTSSRTDRSLREMRAYLVDVLTEAQLPSEREWMKKLGVSRVTVRRALAILKREGLISSRAGKGFFRTASAQPGSTSLGGCSMVLSLTDIDSYNVHMFKTIIEESAKHDIRVLTHVNEADAQKQIRFLRGLTEQPRLRGLLTNPPLNKRHFDELVGVYHDLERNGIPVVLLNAPYPDVKLDNVSFDDQTGMAMLTKYLLNLGHRRVAFVTSEDDSVRTRERFKGYRHAMIENGTRGWVTKMIDRQAASGRVIEFDPDPIAMVKNRGVTVWIAFNEGVATTLYQTLAQAGLQVPRDVSIAGYDRLEHIRYPVPFEFTSVRRDRVLLGKTAFNLLFSRLMTGELSRPKAQHVLLPVELVVGESCRSIRPC